MCYTRTTARWPTTYSDELRLTPTLYPNLWVNPNPMVNINPKPRVNTNPIRLTTILTLGFRKYVTFKMEKIMHSSLMHSA